MAVNTQLYVAKNPTGLNEKVKDFETTILKQQHTGDVQVVGIFGLGGVGKTTLAKEIFNRKQSQYSRSYFLADVRENARISLHSLQSKLMKGLFHLHWQIDSIHRGTEVLRQFFSSCTIFLILDDIDHVNQVDVLLPDRSFLHKDSLILITSRDEGVLARSGVKGSSMYRLTGLPYYHSQQLFCLYAFCQPYSKPGFEDIVDKILMACDGLPLSLIVFGALLSGYNDKCDWEAILHQLELPEDIKNILKVSYDALAKEEQQIFLDIDCFLIGENKNSAVTVWEGSGWKGSLGFKNLQLKCLVEVDSREVIHMHDHLRDLGREIAENELPRRLCRRTAGNINDWLLQQASVLAEARGIRLLPGGHSTKQVGTSSQMLSWYQRNRQILRNRVMKPRSSYRFLGFEVMNLQLVETEGDLLDDILRLPSPNLIWLSWRDCPYTYLPSWISIKNLRVLKVDGRQLETLWHGKSQVPLQLEELEISTNSRLLSIPESTRHLKHLERIVILCFYIAKLPEEIGHLNSLRALVLSAGGSLKSLPNSLTSLTNLHRLDLSWCHKLERLPDSFGSLTNLHDIALSCCCQLKRLPDSFGSLTNLTSITLWKCKKLERLQDSFGSLTNLHSLDLSQCHQLERLPDSFGSLTNLHSLYLSECTQLERLPDSFGSLTNLHKMVLSECKKLERLPDSFGSLPSLVYFDASSCANLTISSETFGNIRTLQHIDFEGCGKVEIWPWQLAHQRSLKTLKLTGTNLKKELASVIELPSDLEVLWIANPLLDTVMPSLGGFRELKDLHLEYRQEVKCLPASIERPSQLRWLKVAACPIIHISEVLSDEVVYPNLTHFTLECINVVEIGTLPKALTSVTLDRCYNLRSIQGICGLPMLQFLTIKEWINVVEIGTLPEALTCVKLSSCYNLRSIEGLCGLPMLRDLHIEKCNELEELPSVGTMASLR
eukprot:PITA_06895